MDAVDLAVGLVVLVGLVGIVVPLLPGTGLIAVAVLVWAFVVGGAEAWAYAAVAVLLLVAGTVVKYAVPGRRLRADGVPNRTLLLGGVLAVVGFFVVPVVGSLRRVRARRLPRRAPACRQCLRPWPSTKSASRPSASRCSSSSRWALTAAAVWLVGAVAT